MSEESSRTIILPKNVPVIGDLVNRLKLILRLLGDPRVSIFLKAIPIASAIYFVIPDLVIGPLDDAGIIWLATSLFVELCPPDVVAEHMQAIQGLPHAPFGFQGYATDEDEVVEGEVIEGDFQDL